MKLIIKRNQNAKTGMFGGHKGMSFVLSCRVELTPEEAALIAKYKAEYHPLTFGTDREGKQVPQDTVSSLMQGVTQELGDIGILLKNEQVIKDACAGFKQLLTVMATFGGQEVVEF